MFTLQIFQYLVLTNIGATIGFSIGFSLKNRLWGRICILLTSGSTIYMVQIISKLMLATAT